MTMPSIEPATGQPVPDERVNVNDSGEAHEWCVKFQCTPAQLDTAVRKVGTSASAVKRELAVLWRGSGI